MAKKIATSLVKNPVLVTHAVFKTAQLRLKSIASQASSFKIGETGTTLKSRKSQPDYNTAYGEIAWLYKSKNKILIDQLESKLITFAKRYYPIKCKNIDIESHGLMTDASGIYMIYIVYNL
jgi:hypothetical protein